MADGDSGAITPEVSPVQTLRSYSKTGFEIIGYIASIAGIITFISWLFFENKAISASYKQAVLAHDGIAFNAMSILSPNLSEWKKIVEISVIVWNSGSQAIEPKDVRRDIDIVVDASSKIIDARPGLQKSNKPDDFKFQDSGKNSYKLTWDVLDPNDFFEAHFLIGTNVDDNQLNGIVQIDGLVSGNVKPSYRALSGMRDNRNGFTFLCGFILGGIIIFLFFSWVDKHKRVKDFFNSSSILSGFGFFASLVLGFSFSFYSAFLIASYIWKVPVWLEPFHPPFS